MAFQREAVAHHEAGHAVAAHQLGERFHSVTVVAPAPYFGAIFYFNPGPNPDFGWEPPRPLAPVSRELRWALENEAIVAAAGPVAETVFRGRAVSRGWHGDESSLLRIALQLAPGRSCLPWLQFIWCRAVDLLFDVNAWLTVELVARELLRRDSLLREDVERLALEARCMDDSAVYDRIRVAEKFLYRRPCPLIRRPGSRRSRLEP